MEISEDGEFDDDFNFDEPDDGCIAPAYKDNGYENHFTPLRELNIKGVSRPQLEGLLFYMLRQGTFFCTDVKRFLNVTGCKAEKVCDILEQAGYIGRNACSKKHHMKLSIYDLNRLLNEK